MTTSKPLFAYLQRPDNGEWVTVGRYLFDEARQTGLFRYAPSYVDGGLSWSIDPVNLPFRPGHDWMATRYNGLHDALRDASPDAWGRALLRRQQRIPEDAPDWRYLEASSNAERWGALAVGCPPEDQVELFGRMVFNAVCGNDDDHPRNHAVIYQPQEKRWRLSPAFDVVPNPDADMAPVLSMQISLGRHETMREAMLADSVRFGFSERDAAVGCLNDLLQRIEHSFDAAAQLLTDELREMMVGRMRKHISLLRT